MVGTPANHKMPMIPPVPLVEMGKKRPVRIPQDPDFFAAALIIKLS
jgi:hypothetical protein